jgi:hypothetical protein
MIIKGDQTIVEISETDESCRSKSWKNSHLKLCRQRSVIGRRQGATSDKPDTNAGKVKN